MTMIPPSLVTSAAILILVAAPTFGQVTTATLYGVVQDPTGAAVSGAAAQLTNTDTGIKIERVTDWNGEFAFEFLPVGTYTLHIEKSGFRAYQWTGLELRAGQEVRQSLALQVGALSEQV